MHLIPLIKCKIFAKNPNTTSFSAEDELRINLDYKSNLFRNKLPVMVSKQTKESETIKVQGKVEDDRRYTIEASVIKVMKARRKLEYVNLISETSKILQLKFNPEPAQIKLRIESLIERGYIERDEVDKRIFKYIA